MRMLLESEHEALLAKAAELERLRAVVRQCERCAPALHAEQHDLGSLETSEACALQFPHLDYMG